MAFSIKKDGDVIMQEGQLPTLGDMFAADDGKTDEQRSIDEGQIGLEHLKAGRLREAIEYFDRSVSIFPKNVPSLNNLSVALWRGGYFLEAAKCARQAFEVQPNHASLANFSNAVHSAGDLETAVNSARQALMMSPESHEIHSMLLMELSLWDQVNPWALAAEHKAFGSWLTQSNPGRIERTNTSDKIKVGYLSNDLRQHSVTWFFEPILEAHDRDKVEVYVYSYGEKDAITERILSKADGWVDAHGLSDEALAHVIRKDGLDVLVEMGGHTASNKLRVVANRLAPVQCNWLGYPNSTGVPSIDYKITDWDTVPRGSEFFYSEKLARIKNGSHVFRPVYDKDVPVRKKRNGIVFGSFNRICKMTSITVGLWAEVLKAVPNSKLLIKTQGLQDEGARGILTALFSRNGVDPTRLILSMPDVDMYEHLSRYNEVDIALDALPYSGTTTTCEALWMGTPVVCGTGNVPQARVCESILRSAGLEELVASTPQEYVRLAKSLAEDKERLYNLQDTLRPRIVDSPLRDARRVAGSLEGLYRKMVEAHAMGDKLVDIEG